MTRFTLTMKLAEGFFSIGRFEDSWDELEKLAPVAKAHPEVLLLRLRILNARHRWTDAVELGKVCCRDWRSYSEFYLLTAEALIQLGKYSNALNILTSSQESLKEEAEYHYAIARCNSRLGQFDQAIQALRLCFERDSTFRKRGLSDPDLEAVWRSL